MSRGSVVTRFKDYGGGDVEVQTQTLEPLQDGVSPMGEVVALTPEKGHAPFYRVETLAEAPVKAHPGPANVSSEAYRDGWDRIFGGVPDESAN